jgi:phenylpropionate dioxygenase-like ring-hydroxylating dioxygenase large terminal subunit
MPVGLDAAGSSTLAGALADHRRGFALPRALTLDPSIHAAELEAIWRSSRLPAGVACEAREPGDFFCLDLEARDSVIVVRDEDGGLRALHNTCRHRGMPVCARSAGQGGDVQASSDHAVLTRLLPDGPGHTRIRVTWLVDEAAAQGHDYALEELLPFWQLTSEQDWSLCERNHVGVSNPAFVPGPYHPAREANVIAFVDWYLG